jgi:hypothetical protein
MPGNSTHLITLWSCPKCGWAGPSGKGLPVRVFPVRCICGHVERAPATFSPSHYVTCPHRGNVLQTMNARKAGCGCSSSVTNIYRCRHFNEPVLTFAPDRCFEQIREECPGFSGRICRTCKIPMAKVPKSTATVQRLAAVTCLFNPHRGQKRLTNYHRFAKGMKEHGIPLFTIEATFGHPAEVDSTWQIAIDPEAVFWHKERLLNLAVQRLPDKYDAVLWLDADILYRPSIPDLSARCLDELRANPIIMPWGTCQHWDANDRPIRHRMIAMAKHNAGRSKPDTSPSLSHPGLGWGARREVLAKAGGHYDRAITGSGDSAFAFSCWDDPSRHSYCQRVWNEGLFQDVLRWRERFYPLVRNSVGYVDATIVHLWHGSSVNRQYHTRHKVLTECHFDPQKHLDTAPNGTLRWSKYAPERLRRALREYMLGRKEDEPQ